MNIDYSKVSELLNQDAEKERDEKAEKAVYDNSYHRGYRKGYSRGYEEGVNNALSELRKRVNLEKLGFPPSAGYYRAIRKVLDIIDTYRESEKT